MSRTKSIHALALTVLSFVACAAPPPRQPARPPASSPAFDAPTGVAVPVGTIFMVRMYDSVNTKQHKVGHRWTATLEADMVVEGQTIAPRGSVIYGVVSQLQSAGRLVGKSSLTLQPTDLLIGSRMFPLGAGEVQAVAAQSSTGSSAGKVARGAAIGGLAGGSRGAKGGAKWGLGAALLTDDGQIQVASGTLLQFPLLQPLTF